MAQKEHIELNEETFEQETDREAMGRAYPEDGAKRLLDAGFRLRSRAAESEVQEPMETNAIYTLADRLGTWKVRWGINRMNHTVVPGLYRLGQPDKDAPVLVTANYKMSFDMLRRELKARNLWLLVLDTKGINVWCAAGKGTFGTEEIVRQVKRTALASRVSHRKLILPQLGAPGVSAREVRRQSGFSVVYGPVRAADLPAYLDNGGTATPVMRRVRFSFMDRLVLSPIEIVSGIKPLLLILGAMFLLNALGLSMFDRFEAAVLVVGLLSGALLVPVLLPWIPGRSFSLKGLLMGAVAALGLLVAVGFQPVGAAVLPNSTSPGWVLATSGTMVLLAVSSYLGMNFTGCSTYTSPSGVRKEMKWAVPLQAGLVLLGGLGIVTTRILQAMLTR